VALLAAILVIGTVGFMLIEHWPLLDALYMTVITVGTVGFGEVHPLSAVGRVFTIGLILSGVGALGFVVATFIDFLVEGHLRGILEERRMEKLLDNMAGHHIVAGIGRVGFEVASAFEAEGEPFVVIDNCVDCIQAALERGWVALAGDATEERVLRGAGIGSAGSLVTALDSDAANVFVTLTARTLNPRLFIVARSGASFNEDKLLKAGADRVITPSVIGGRRMASMVMHPFVSDYLELISGGNRPEMRLEEITVEDGTPYVGRRLRDAGIYDSGVFVLAVQSASGDVIANPASDTILEADGRLVVMGTVEQLERLADTLQGP
jgi:voltage-gated potassium channel